MHRENLTQTKGIRKVCRGLTGRGREREEERKQVG
jgi:hypothetical protein